MISDGSAFSANPANHLKSSAIGAAANKSLSYRPQLPRVVLVDDPAACD